MSHLCFEACSNPVNGDLEQMIGDQLSHGTRLFLNKGGTVVDVFTGR